MGALWLLVRSSTATAYLVLPHLMKWAPLLQRMDRRIAPVGLQFASEFGLASFYFWVLWEKDIINILYSV